MITFAYGVFLDVITEADCPTLRKWRNAPEIRKWCRQTGLVNDIRQAGWFEWQAQDMGTRMYAIKTGKPIRSTLVGVCGLTSIEWEVTRRAEFSLYIGPDHQGKGLGKAALLTLLHHGFQDLCMHGIWGESFEDNPARKMFEDMGFKHEGVRRDFYWKAGRYINAHLYSILEDEWRQIYLPS